jgi:hypothetical protein
MSDLINTYKLEIDNLKEINKKLIKKTKLFYGRTKNQKRTILRLKKLIADLRKSTKDNISDGWDCIDEKEEL